MKKVLSVLLLSLSVLLITGCFDKKKEETKSNESNSNVESNVESNVASNVESNSNNIVSNTVTSNTTPSNTVTSNTTPSTPVGNKELSCTMDMSNRVGGSGYKSAVSNLKVNFENSSVKLITMDMIFELDSTLVPQIDMLISTMKSTLASQYSNMQGVTVTTNKLSASKFDILINMDIDKMNPEDRNKTNFSSSNYEDIKKSLISSGYTCK